MVSAVEKLSRAPVLRRITWDDGLADWPALSNDGRLLAFASDRAEGGRNLDIFIRLMSGGEPIRLTNNPPRRYRAVLFSSTEARLHSAPSGRAAAFT